MFTNNEAQPHESKYYQKEELCSNEVLKLIIRELSIFWTLEQTLKWGHKGQECLFHTNL